MPERMSTDRGPSYVQLVEHGLGFAVGVMLAAFALNSMFWFSYQQANPAIGGVSTSPGFLAFYAALFLAGSIVAYVAFMDGLSRVLSG